jgi:hypothetical protein
VPFRSKSQQRYLFKFHPDVAKRFAAETPKSAYKKLPEHTLADHLVREMSKKKKKRGSH